uniref:ANK_REP_REGION domain-containing protein n=1 Tax=Globodera pallida TaxID=36090 RepID=A0A183BTU3_GLOPA
MRAMLKGPNADVLLSAKVNGVTALSVAIQNGNAEVVELLRAKGAMDEKKKSPVIFALTPQNRWDSDLCDNDITLFEPDRLIAETNGLAARSEQNIPGDPDYFSRIKKAYDFLRALDAKALAEYAFIKLAESGDVAQMRSLLRTLHLDAVELKRLLSAGLFNAAKNGHIKMARLLLKRGADQRETGTVTVDGQMINKVTPLRVAAFNGHLEMCKLLVAHGKANVNQLLTWIYGFFGWAPSDQQDIKQIVCAACYAGHLDIVKYFGTGIDDCGRLALAAASFHGRDDILNHLLSERKASAERSGSSSSSSSSSSSKPPRGNADPLYGVVFIIGVIFLALANYYLPAPVCAALLFTAIFAFYNYRSKLYNLLPEQFFDVITDTHALYMEKLKRLFPDRQEMPFGIGAPYNSVKQTLTQMSESWTLENMVPGCGSSSSSSSSSKPPRGNADPLYGVVFIIGVIFLALANYYLPAPVCAALLFTAIFAFYNYRSKLYNLLPEQFFDVITDTHVLYMEKLKRLFPDRQEMPFGIGAPYNSVKQTLTQMSESNLLKWTPGCGNMPNTARKILKMLSPICPALLNDVGRVFVGAVLIFAVGSLFVYDLKAFLAVVSTYILLIFVAFFVKFGVDDIKRRQ